MSKQGELMVSVVIPVYNIEGYVGQMLECVARQTWQNMEVIVINDGSTDATLQEVEKREELFRNIKIINIPNGGVSNARNIGIKHVGGGKIFFWDGDDTMEPDTIERCIRFAESHQVNAVLYGYANRVDGIKGRPHLHELRQEYRGREIVEQLMPHFLGHSFDDINQWIKGKRSMRQGKEHTALWRIMLDTETIRRSGLHFDCSLSLGEDTRFINEYMLHEQSIGFMDECLYYLTIRQTGANLTSMTNVEKRQADKLKLIKARKEIDQQALVLYSADAHCYWEGTMVFSALELIVMLIRNRKLGIRVKVGLYKEFIGNEDVKSAVKKFHPAFGLKAIPFWMLKCIMIFC